jgi:hypothetical protein
MAPRQITDINSLLHVNQVSLRPEQRSCWLLIILTVLCAFTILVSLCFSLRFRLRTATFNLLDPKPRTPVVLEKDGEQLDRSCEKRRSIT